MKYVSKKFKSGGLHEKHVVATWSVGNRLAAFAYRHRETKKNLCRGGRSHHLPDSDLWLTIRQLKYVRQQYTHSEALHMR